MGSCAAASDQGEEGRGEAAKSPFLKVLPEMSITSIKASFGLLSEVILSPIKGGRHEGKIIFSASCDAAIAIEKDDDEVGNASYEKYKYYFSYDPQTGEVTKLNDDKGDSILQNLLGDDATKVDFSKVLEPASRGGSIPPTFGISLNYDTSNHSRIINSQGLPIAADVPNWELATMEVGEGEGKWEIDDRRRGVPEDKESETKGENDIEADASPSPPLPHKPAEIVRQPTHHENEPLTKFPIANYVLIIFLGIAVFFVVTLVRKAKGEKPKRGPRRGGKKRGRKKC